MQKKRPKVPKEAPGAILAAQGAAGDHSRERGAGPKATFWSQQRLLGEFFSAVFAAKNETKKTCAESRFEANFI